jgi:hypothetical protein
MGDLWRTKGVREEIEEREVQDDWMREVTRVNKLGRKERNPCTGGSHVSGSFNNRGFIYLPMFTMDELTLNINTFTDGQFIGIRGCTD